MTKTDKEKELEEAYKEQLRRKDEEIKRLQEENLLLLKTALKKNDYKKE